MALPVLDGNQTATTLSSVVTGGEHIVAHTVVSLGSAAISNITNAVSGSVVSISNFPSTQTVAGTVTANAGGDLSGAIEIVNDVSNVSHKIAVQLYDDNGSAIGVPSNPIPISGTVTLGNSVTIGSLPAISGTVTANGGDFASAALYGVPPPTAVQIGYVNSGGDFIRVAEDGEFFPVQVKGTLAEAIENCGDAGNATQKIAVQLYDDTGVAVGVSANPLPISGTVTLGNSVTIGSLPAISGTVTANVILGQQADFIGDGYPNLFDLFQSGVLVVGSLPAISGTVTVGAMPSGSLTTRFGTVTTANTAQITSAVTNTSRKYLLAQNISAGTVTIGIGFSPTTTQGIQLTAGGGLTFDAFCPTGAVYWLGAVTGAAFTILEG